MTTDPRKPEDESTIPANPMDIPEKAVAPDADKTVPGTMPRRSTGPASDDPLSQEHHTGRDHAEPTKVTDASNDAAIDSEYIDVGGGD